MLINKLNADLINTKRIYLHDSKIMHTECFLEERKIVISIYPDKLYSNIIKMTFNNVVGTKTTLFEVFGMCSGEIIDFYLLKGDEARLTNELYEDSEREKARITSYNDKGEKIESEHYSNIDDREGLIEVEFFLVSADRLTIVCESIEIETENDS